MRLESLLASLIAGVVMLPVNAHAGFPHQGSPLAQARDDTGEAGESPDLDARPKAPPRAQTVAVFILTAAESGLREADVWASARKAIETHTALNVAALDATESKEAIRECAGRAECFVQKMRASAGAIGLALLVSIDRLDEGLLLGCRLVDVNSEQEVGATGDEIPMGMSLVGAMEQQLADVFPQTIWGQIASVNVETTPPNAEVSLGGRNCASPCELTRMIPGTYEVQIKKAGYEPWSGTVTLTPDRPASVNTVLVEPPGGITSSPLFWGAIGAAVIGAGVATFFLLRPQNRTITLCIAPSEAICSM